MISVKEAFETFKSRLELSETESADAIRRHSDVRNCIKAAFDIKRDFLTGSYKRHTKTKPLKDIDIFFVLNSSEAGRRAKPPSQMIDAFEACLVEKYGRDSVDRGRRCVTVEFEKRNPSVEGRILSIDAVPAFEDGENYEIPDDKLGKWIKSNPEVHAAEATSKNKECDGAWIPLVKMIKRWNRSAGNPVKPSFLLEVMGQSLVVAPFTDYPNEVRSFFASARVAVHHDFGDPAGLGPPVSDQMTSAMRTTASEAFHQAELQAMRAMQLERQGKAGEALSLWQDVMGTYFPTS